MKLFNKQKGNRGEDLAADYLEREGWKILDRNFSVKWGEIDIIATKDKTLAFIEVKTKTGDKFGTPESMITKGKILQVKKMADVYVEKNARKVRNYDVYRIDMIAVTLDEEQADHGGVAKLNYYENVGAEFV